MREQHIAFVTCATVPELTRDDRLLASELESRGHAVSAVVWDAPERPWSEYDGVIVRSTWDYHLRVDAFVDFIRDVEQAGARMWNPPALMRWNTNKKYLRELGEAGVPVVPTEWVPQHEQRTLQSIVIERGWEAFVVKPSVSASAHRTWRGAAGEAAVLEPNFRAAVTHGDVLVQPFLPEVMTAGEWSVLFYGGRFSHAVIKRPRADDFRVQREHGGSSTPAEPPAHVVAEAHAALQGAESLQGGSVYARVDGCVVNGRFVLMELELIEPDLFLRSHADAPRRLADALDL